LLSHCHSLCLLPSGPKEKPGVLSQDLIFTGDPIQSLCSPPPAHSQGIIPLPESRSPCQVSPILLGGADGVSMVSAVFSVLPLWSRASGPDPLPNRAALGLSSALLLPSELSLHTGQELFPGLHGLAVKLCPIYLSVPSPLSPDFCPSSPFWVRFQFPDPTMKKKSDQGS
jgi:hypothetical protein